MAAYLDYTLRMKTLFRGWPVMLHDMHTRRRASVWGYVCLWVGTCMCVCSYLWVFVSQFTVFDASRLHRLYRQALKKQDQTKQQTRQPAPEVPQFSSTFLCSSLFLWEFYYVYVTSSLNWRYSPFGASFSEICSTDCCVSFFDSSLTVLAYSTCNRAERLTWHIIVRKCFILLMQFNTPIWFKFHILIFCLFHVD